MFLYDFWNAFGVRVEHTRQLCARRSGCTVFLAVWFVLAEPRRSLKWLGVLALVAASVRILGRSRDPELDLRGRPRVYRPGLLRDGFACACSRAATG